MASTKFLLPSRFTTDSGLLTSTPVSASNASLLRFNQAMVSTHPSMAIQNLAVSNLAAQNLAQAAPTQRGTTATEYIGGLTAMNHSLAEEAPSKACPFPAFTVPFLVLSLLRSPLLRIGVLACVPKRAVVVAIAMPRPLVHVFVSPRVDRFVSGSNPVRSGRGKGSIGRCSGLFLGQNRRGRGVGGRRTRSTEVEVPFEATRSSQQPWMWSWSGRAGEKRKEKTKLIEELKKELKDARRQNNVNVQIVEDLTAAVEEQAQEIAKLREKGNMQEVKMKILVDMWAMRFLDEQHEKNRGCLQK